MVVPVVVVHRTRPLRLAATLAALADQTVPVRVVLVDSGSEPDHLAVARRLLGDDDEIVTLPHNVGFGPAANAGWRRVLSGPGSDWIALCPHDAIPAPDAIERIIAAAEARNRAGLACADYGDGYTPVIDPYFGGILVPAEVERGWEPAGHPHGTLLLARRAFLDDVGLFDERYFAYGEEADLGLRASAAGWEIGLVRGAMVTNPDLSNAGPVVDYLMTRNTLLLVREHFGRYKVSVRFVLACIQLVTDRRRGPYFDSRARMWAMADFLCRRLGPPPDGLTEDGPSVRRRVAMSRQP